MLSLASQPRLITHHRHPTATLKNSKRPKMAALVAAGGISGKTCVVTGANRGIGLEFTRQLLAKSNRVVVGVRDTAKAKDLRQLAEGSGDNLVMLPLDVADLGSIQAFADGVAAKFPHVDYLINNAGVVDSWRDLDDVTPQDMVRCFTVNAMGPLFVTQQLKRRGLLGGSRSVVANVTSKMGSVDDNGSGGCYAYRASKAALNIVNKSLSIDLSDANTTCVLLHPGYVKTDMTGGAGLIDTRECVRGLIKVLEGGKPLNGRWYDYKGVEVPW